MTIAEKAEADFLEAVRGIPGNHVIAAVNVATPGVEWRHCSKSHIAKAYGTVMGGERYCLSSTANDAMRAIDLAELRRACIERARGSAGWHLGLEEDMQRALYPKQEEQS